MKINIHSIVDVITNSSTVIYTYQDSIKEAKELVQEVLDISGIIDKTPDDIFYYGVFCDDDTYFDSMDEEDGGVEDCPTIDWNNNTTKEQRDFQRVARNKWLDDLELSIMKGEVAKPKWMEAAENDDCNGFLPDTHLVLIPKDDKFKPLAEKIYKLLGSVTADGGRDG